MGLKIWGCRGSVPAPGSDTVDLRRQYVLRRGDAGGEAALVLDAGTGIRALGLDLVRRGTRRIHLFLTHLHLDHLEGLRFFAPLWDESVTLEIWGPRSPVLSLRDRILRAFSPPLFPLDFRDVPARVPSTTCPTEPWRAEGVTLVADLVLHPGPTVGFRSRPAVELAYLPDHEPALAGIEGRSLDWISGGALAARRRPRAARRAVPRRGVRREDRLGTLERRPGRRLLPRSRRPQLVLFHHDPERSDRALELLEARARELTGG